MGITADTSYPQPLSHTHADQKASERALQFYVGWFMNPIYGKNGNYPKIMIDRIGELSRQQGFSKSRLPTFTHEEIKMIHNTSDFFGINSYTSVLVTPNDDETNPAKYPIPSFFHDMGTIETQDDSWPSSGSVWLRVSRHILHYFFLFIAFIRTNSLCTIKLLLIDFQCCAFLCQVHPSGMRHLLNWIRKEYDNPPVYVTENGVSDKGKKTRFSLRNYLKSFSRWIKRL
jgi:beta-glucosidase/6-phospho-beta-glucosidase/beta-galactosidase